MLQPFLHTIRSNDLFTVNDKLVIAASGGLDSTVLCELCHLGGYDFKIAHCNFQLRGEESEREEAFVRTLGEKYNCEVLVRHFDTKEYAILHKLSTQEAARELRYEWFFNLVSPVVNQTINPTFDIRHSKFSFLLTAHHVDDSIETLLMNFFRGTGLHGLTGIPMRNQRIRRPLLEFSRQELEDFARERGLTWVEDSTNASLDYTRNFFRNALLPSIEKVYPQVRQNLAANLQRFAAIEKQYRLATGEMTRKLMQQQGKEWHIPVKQLMQFKSPALVYEIISAFGFQEKQVGELYKLALSDSGKYIVSPNKEYRIIRHRHWFIISPANNLESGNIMIEKDQQSVKFEKGVLEFRELREEKFAITSDAATALVNLSLLKFPLHLRKWKMGDYFYPLGMSKKKKLSRFFIDQKFSTTQKENTWVLEDADGRIIWVVGVRIDERFKITEKTIEVFQMKFKGD